MPSLYGGRGLGNYFDSLSALPQAAYTFSNAIGQGALQGMENTRLWKESENARERQRRDEKTAERKARQGMLTNLGIGIGGAAVGAGIGTALAAPAAGAMTGGGLTTAAQQTSTPPPPQVPMTSPPAGPYSMSAALGEPNQLGTYQQGTINAPAPSMTDYRSAIPVDGTSVLGDPYQPPQQVPQTFQPPTTQPEYGLSLGDAGPGPMFDMPESPKYGWLGNSKGQVFGNLFLQGLGGVVPGMSGVAQGINTAQQMNYRTGRDAISDQFRERQLGIAQEGVDARKAYYNRPGSLGGGEVNYPPLYNAMKAQGMSDEQINAALLYQGGQDFRPLHPSIETRTIGSAASSFANPLIPKDIRTTGQNQVRNQLGGSSPEMQRLDAMRNSGEVTQEEYEELKRRLMTR